MVCVGPNRSEKGWEDRIDRMDRIKILRILMILFVLPIRASLAARLVETPLFCLVMSKN